jgi:hypothetical protein
MDTFHVFITGFALDPCFSDAKESVGLLGTKGFKISFLLNKE